MAHIHEVKDADRSFIIDPVSRQITPQGETVKPLMQFDHNSEVATFELPRLVENHDMMTCNKIEVHYINSDTETENKGVYIVNSEDIETDEEKVKFSWLISRACTMLNGKLDFLIHFICEIDSVIEYEWSTDFFSSIEIKKGLNNRETVLSTYIDVLEAFKAEIGNVPVPDWAENNVLSKDYIKNRTHWHEKATDEILFTTANVTFNPELNNGASLNVRASDFNIEETYEVIWNGVHYPVKAETVNIGQNDNSVIPYRYFGNVTIFAGSGIVTNEPFVIIMDMEDKFATVMVADFNSLTAPLNVSIEIKKPAREEKYHKLDNNYLDFDWLPVSNVKVLEGKVAKNGSMYGYNEMFTDTAERMEYQTNIFSKCLTSSFVFYLNGTKYDVPPMTYSLDGNYYMYNDGTVRFGIMMTSYGVSIMLYNASYEGTNVSLYMVADNPLPDAFIPKPIVFTIDDAFSDISCNKSFEDCVKAYNAMNFNVWASVGNVKMQCHRLAYDGTTFSACFEIGIEEVIIEYTANGINKTMSVTY